MKQKKNDLNKNKVTKRFQNYILLACMLSLMIMLMTVVGSMFYFRAKLTEKANELDTPKYKDYDAYYVFITENDKSAFFQSVIRGAQQEAEKQNAYVELLGTQFSEEYDKYQLMQIAICSKVDGIIVQAGEDAKMTQLIQKAEQEGIPVVTLLEDNTGGGRQSFISVPSHNLGLEYGKQIADIVESKASQLGLSDDGNGGYVPLDVDQKIHVLVLLNGDITDNSQNTALTAMNEILEQKQMGSFIRLETQQIFSDSAFSPEEAIRDIFIAREIRPDIIVCLNEQNTVCAYQAVVDYNRVGQTEIIGYYESDMIRSAIEKNIIWSSVTIDTTQMGAYCVDALTEYRESGYVSDYYAVDISLLSSDSLSDEQIGGNDEESN